MKPASCGHTEFSLRTSGVVGLVASLPALPPQAGEGTRLMFYAGSSIGNFTPEDARQFLRNLRDILLPRRRPPLHLSSRPAAFWPDVFVEAGWPARGFLRSALATAAAPGFCAASTNRRRRRVKSLEVT